MTDWQEVTIEKIASRDRYSVVGGPFGSALGRKDYVDHGVPVIRGAQLGGPGSFSHENLVFVSEEKADRHRGNLAQPGDVLVTQRGTVGQVGLIPDLAPYDRYLLSQSQMKLTVDPARAEARFIYYWLLSDAAQHQMRGATISAGVPHINLETFKSMRLRLPPLPTQRSIASALGTIDGLIENNQRRIDLLEASVRAIYREWFLHFRFPGHETVALVDSPPGQVPDGWTWSTCNDELNFIGGGTPSKMEPSYWEDGTVPWYTPSDLTKNRWRYAAAPELCITETGVANSSARRFPAGSVLMTSRATLGVLAIATSEATTNQGFIVVLPDDRWSPGFIREWLDARASELAAIGTGATFKEITKGAFKRVPFLLPPQNVLDAYTTATEPIEMQILNLERQIRSLSTLRNFLLPRLVSGQIDVSPLDLDGMVQESVA